MKTDLCHGCIKFPTVQIFPQARLDLGFILLDEVCELFEVVDPIIYRSGNTARETSLQPVIDLHEGQPAAIAEVQGGIR